MPRAKLKTLDDLLVQAREYANYSMQRFGQMPPALFLTGPDGPGMFIAESLADGTAKDDFATTGRLLCIAHAATSVVTAMEAWVRFATPGEKLDQNERPSEAIDRREFVVLMGESQDGLKQTFLPIIRDGNGKFFGFGEGDGSKMDQMEGRFAGLLPVKNLDPGVRDMAKTLLDMKGIRRTNPMLS